MQLPFMMECMLVLLTNSELLGGGSAWTFDGNESLEDPEFESAEKCS